MVARERMPLGPESCMNAAEGRHLEVLQRARTRGFGMQYVPARWGTAATFGAMAASNALLSATYDAGSSFFSVFSSKKSVSDFLLRSFEGFLKYLSSNFFVST